MPLSGKWILWILSWPDRSLYSAFYCLNPLTFTGCGVYPLAAMRTLSQKKDLSDTILAQKNYKFHRLRRLMNIVPWCYSGAASGIFYCCMHNRRMTFLSLSPFHKMSSDAVYGWRRRFWHVMPCLACGCELSRHLQMLVPLEDFGIGLIKNTNGRS